MRSDDEGRDPHGLATELARRSNAITALVTLCTLEGATLGELHQAARCPTGQRLGQDLRWLAAVGLVRRESASGSWDVSDPAAIYRLSEPEPEPEPGHALAKSLAELAEGCANLRIYQEHPTI